MRPTERLSAEQINQKYAQAVATACDRHFPNLVPHHDRRDNLFTHLFRSVYAAIATHYIISEATKRISSELRLQYPEVPWHEMAGLRDILAPQYDHVDLETI
jgi:Protein of unknown function DUF86